MFAIIKAFSLIISAEVCFSESLQPTSNAARSCIMVGGNVTCTYVCKAGYIYYDGTTSKQYHCSGANKWSPTANPEDCLCKYQYMYFNILISVSLTNFKTPVICPKTTNNLQGWEKNEFFWQAVVIWSTFGIVFS